MYSESMQIHSIGCFQGETLALDDLHDDDDEPVAATLINSVMTVSQPLPGSLIIPDPYETYLKTLLAGASSIELANPWSRNTFAVGSWVV